MTKFRTTPRCMMLAVCSCFFCAPTFAAQQSLSLQGYTGALNVPSAFTAPQGQASLQYADPFFYGDNYEHNDNLIGNFGLLSFLEAGGRISWDTTHTNCFQEDCGVRDLSANLKISAPFIPEHWFSLAAGVQDFGGKVNYFSSKYVVASKQFRYGRIDLGQGRTELPNRYLDGSFAAVELQPWDWVGLIAEYDAKDFNGGFRLGLPEPWRPWGVNPELKVMAMSNRDNAEDARFFGLSINIPMGSSKLHYADPHAARAPLSEPKAQASPTPFIAEIPQTAVEMHNTQSQAFYQTLADQLSSDRFEKVLIGEQNGVLYVACENNQFNRNELDAVAWILKRVSVAARNKYANAHLVLKNQNLPVLDIAIQPENYTAFLEDTTGAVTLVVDARYPEPGLLKHIVWFAESSYGFALKPRVSFSPSLVTAVATEYGVWDYSLSMQTDAAISLWKGALIGATYNMPVDQSEDFERFAPKYAKQGVFYPDRQRSKFDEYEFQQTLMLSNGLFTTMHAGHFMRDYDGFYNQTAWFSPAGDHKLTLRAGSFEHEDNPKLERDVSLLSYRYFVGGQDVSIETTYGEFWEGDEGYRIDTRFWFGDTAVTLEYKDTAAQFVGMRWTLPLTPRRDWLTPYGQLKGRENWHYGLQTRINEDANLTSFGSAVIPRTRNEIERVYMNNDRLSPTYLKTHWRRLKEAVSESK